MSFSTSFPIDFTGFNGSGFQPTPGAGQLDSDLWRIQGFNGTSSTGEPLPAGNSDAVLDYGESITGTSDWARGVLSGDPSTAGVYAVNTGVPALGTAFVIQPTGAEFGTTPGTITLRAQYTGAQALSSFSFDYDGVFRNNADRSVAVNFSYAVSSAASQPASFSANVAALGFTTPLALTTGAGWTQQALDAQIITAAVNQNDYIFLRWSIGDNGGSGSRDEVGFDNILLSTGGAPTPTIGITPASISLSEGNSGTTPYAFTISRSGTAPGDATIAVTFAAGSAGFDGADPVSITLGGVTVPGLSLGSSFNVTLAGAQTSVDVVVNIRGDVVAEADDVFTLSLGAAPTGYALAGATASGTVLNDELTLTAISAIQGSGTASPLVGNTVTIEGVVTGDYQNGDADTGRNLQGFYVQMITGDGNAATSDGIFVFQTDGTSLPITNVNVGDIVRITGVVAESFNETQLTVANSATGIAVTSAGAYTPAQVISDFALAVNLPAAGTVTAAGRVLPNLEFAEGMLISLPQVLTITEAFNADRFGEVRVAQGGQQVQFSQTDAPDATNYAAYLNQLGARSLLIDDGLNVQNPNPITFLGTPLTTAGAPQIGDAIQGLVGNLGYGFNEYRLQAANSPAIIDNQPREAAPGRDGGDLKLVSTNLLNYFTTIDNNTNNTGPGNAFEARGANNAAELARQTQKLYTALTALDADLMVVNELENNGFGAGSAIQTLVDGFNTALGAPGRWGFVDPGVTYLGGDAIKVSILYRTDRLAIATGTTVQVLDDSDVPGLITAGLLPDNFLSQSTVGGVFNGVNTSRAVLVTSFEQLGTGEVFTVAALHNKSKSGIGTGADADALDGAGNWDNQRSLATQAVDAFLRSNPTGTADPDRILMGDFNAYAQETPITNLTDAGYINLIDNKIGNATAASYVFDAQKGYLDYAISTASLLPHVKGVEEWRLNSPEFDGIDYNTDFGRPTGVFDGTLPNRYSDHDPVVVNLLLSPAVTLSQRGVKTDVFNSFAEALAAATANTVVDAVKPGQVGDVGSQVLGAEGLTIQGGLGFAGNFQLGAGVVAANLGGLAALNLRGNAEGNALTGNSGDNTLEGGAGADTINGGAGFDTATYANATAGLTLRLDFANLNTGEAAGDALTGIERIIGSTFSDTLVGTAGSQTLVGNGGNDIFIGRQGADLYVGGAGQDFFAFAFEDFEAGIYDVIQNAGQNDWFVTSGVVRETILALAYQGGVVVSIPTVGFGANGGGFYIENFSLTDFWNQLYTII